MNIERILEDIKSDRVKKVILDSDTYNEMDDQYAVAYALGSKKIDLIALTAAPFKNERSESFADGMKKSYNEILRILKTTGKTGCCPVFEGSERIISSSPDLSPVDSPAARNIIKAALESDEIIYVLATGCCTNVASAIMLEPAIKDKICVVWLGTNDFGLDVREFNIAQDYRAGQILINSGVNLVLLPVNAPGERGTKTLLAKRDIFNAIKNNSNACVFFRDTLPAEFDYDPWPRVIWDIAAPALLTNPSAFELEIIPAPVFTDEYRHAFDATRHKIIYMNKLDPSAVFAGLFETINSL
ncbi:MAG: nucleoside hydrolase [Firmicutes bacterium]|nr:nucleoside hydrolase [Bacillota bacterium]